MRNNTDPSFNYNNIGRASRSLVLLLFGTLMSTTVFAQQTVVVLPLDSGPAPLTEKLIFVTNGSWNGNLGGYEGADEKCNSEARARSISGRFQAMLADGFSVPVRRSIHYPVRYYRIDGKTLRSSFHSLFDPSGPDNPVSPVPGERLVWTGMQAGGTEIGVDCDGWASGSSGDAGQAGDASAGQGDTGWIAEGGFNCSFEFGLYCIEQ